MQRFADLRQHWLDSPSDSKVYTETKMQLVRFSPRMQLLSKRHPELASEVSLLLDGLEPLETTS